MLSLCFGSVGHIICIHNFLIFHTLNMIEFHWVPIIVQYPDIYSMIGTCIHLKPIDSTSPCILIHNAEVHTCLLLVLFHLSWTYGLVLFIIASLLLRLTTINPWNMYICNTYTYLHVCIQTAAYWAATEHSNISYTCVWNVAMQPHCRGNSIW